MNKFGINLMIERKKKKITQQQLSSLLGLERSTISKWENGISEPDLNSIMKISDFLKVPIDQLISRKI